jgi:hypothetical protein
VTRTATAADYQQLCRQVVDELLALGVTPVLVGGSGLYLRAALDELEFPGTDPALRARLEADLERDGPLALHARLAALDPGAATRMEPTNGAAVVRALEVVTLTGSMPGALTSYDARYPTRYLGVDRPDLAERIARRVDRMWEQGLVEEVRGLEAEGLREGVTASRALGYAQVLGLLDGRLAPSAGARADGHRHPALRPPAARVVPAGPADRVARPRSRPAAAGAGSDHHPVGVAGGGTLYDSAGQRWRCLHGGGTATPLTFAAMWTTSHPADHGRQHRHNDPACPARFL